MFFHCEKFQFVTNLSQEQLIFLSHLKIKNSQTIDFIDLMNGGH